MLKPVKKLTLAEILLTLSGGESAQEVRDAIANVSKKVDKVRRDAFDQVAHEIREKTGLPVYITE